MAEFTAAKKGQQAKRWDKKRYPFPDHPPLTEVLYRFSYLGSISILLMPPAI
jgi:hypothetical protein